jgi:hypothetical protein
LKTVIAECGPSGLIMSRYEKAVVTTVTQCVRIAVKHKKIQHFPKTIEPFYICLEEESIVQLVFFSYIPDQFKRGAKPARIVEGWKTRFESPENRDWRLSEQTFLEGADWIIDR